MTRAMEIILWLRNHSVVPMLLVFLLVVAAAYAPRHKAGLQQHAFIPLRDDR